MLTKKILIIGTLSTLFIGTSLFAQEKDCANGVCFATFKKLELKKDFKQEQKKLINLVIEDKLDKSITIIVDGDEIMVFPSYEMTDSEYYLTEELIVQPLENIEDVILEKSELKDSLYYCENKKHPQFNEFSDLYQCV